jgi:hypothetical protein
VLKFQLKNGLKAFESFECPQNAPECPVCPFKTFDSKTIPLLQTLLYELFKPLYGDGRFLSAFMVRLLLQKASCGYPQPAQ